MTLAVIERVYKALELHDKEVIDDDKLIEKLKKDKVVLKDLLEGDDK